MSIGAASPTDRGGDDDLPVLITGGSGFLGSHLVRAFREIGIRPIVADLRAPDSGVEYVELDVRNAEAVQTVLGSRTWRAVVHLAAKHFIPECESDPEGTLDTNVVGTSNVLDALGNASTRLVFASTADVYRPSTEPHTESDPVGGTGVYGLSKLAGERLVRRSGLDATILRFFNLYGPGETTSHLIPEILRQLPSGVVSLGNLDTRRDYVWVHDVAAAVAAATTGRLPTGTYNVGSGTSTSGTRLVDAARHRAGHGVEVRQDAGRLRVSDRPNLQSDSSKLRAALPDWTPTTLDAGFDQLLARTADRVS